MAKILMDGEWFEQMSTAALYEFEYGRLLLSHSEKLFPGYRLLEFSPTVYSDDGAAKPDFALIHKQYREWWIVEAELAHHSFYAHVYPQVQKLSTAVYGFREAEYVCQQCDDLSRDRVHAMVKGLQPRVLVVVNAPRPEWARDIRPLGAIVSVLEVFRSRFNKFLYRLNGEQPIDRGVQSSRCTLELARMLRLHSPGILPPPDEDPIEIIYGGGVTLWRRVEIADAVYLTSDKPVTISKGDYDLLQMEDGNFVLSSC